MVNTEVIRRVAELPKMRTPALKRMWKELYQSDPPAYNKGFLVKRLAFRLQELAYGGLSESNQKQLERLSRDNVLQERKPINQEPDGRPTPGTRLVREWKGVEHCVTVMPDGFEYQGRQFRSLSAVARAITGTRWNGLIFFGLKKQGTRK